MDQFQSYTPSEAPADLPGSDGPCAPGCPRIAPSTPCSPGRRRRSTGRLHDAWVADVSWSPLLHQAIEVLHEDDTAHAPSSVVVRRENERRCSITGVVRPPVHSERGTRSEAPDDARLRRKSRRIAILRSMASTVPASRSRKHTLVRPVPCFGPFARILPLRSPRDPSAEREYPPRDSQAHWQAHPDRLPASIRCFDRPLRTTSGVRSLSESCLTRGS